MAALLEVKIHSLISTVYTRGYLSSAASYIPGVGSNAPTAEDAGNAAKSGAQTGQQGLHAGGYLNLSPFLCLSSLTLN